MGFPDGKPSPQPSIATIVSSLVGANEMTTRAPAEPVHRIPAHRRVFQLGIG